MKMPIAYPGMNLLQERHCKIIFVATATGTAYSKIMFFLSTCTQINKYI